MARTWTLYSTISLPFVTPLPTRALVLGSNMYFRAADLFFGYFKFYKWDGVSHTDIAGTTFSVGSGTSYDFCIFNGSVFTVFGPSSNAISDHVWRYSGSGTSWTDEIALVDEGAAALHVNTAIPGNQEGVYYIMDCDASFMGIVCTKGTGAANWRLVTRNAAGSYSVNQRPGSSYTAFVPQLVGLSKGSQFGSLVGNYDTASASYRPIQIGGPTPWTHLAGSAIGDRRLIGYGDGKSFISVLDGSNWELKYSTDWGVNLTAAGNLEQDGSNRSKFLFKDCGDGVIMLSLETENAYTWDAATDTFVADGSITSGQVIYDYFVLGGILYALCSSLSSNTVEVWTAGPIEEVPEGTPALYYGISTPVFRSETNVLVKPGSGAMVITPDGAVVIGARDEGKIYYNDTPPYNEPADWTEMSTGYASDDVNRIEVV